MCLQLLERLIWRAVDLASGDTFRRGPLFLPDFLVNVYYGCLEGQGQKGLRFRVGKVEIFGSSILWLPVQGWPNYKGWLLGHPKATPSKFLATLHASP